MPAPSDGRFLTLFTLSRFIFPALALFTSPAFADTVKSETRPLLTFHAVDISGSIDVRWSPGEVETAVVKAPDDMMSRIHTEVRDGRLKIFCSGIFTSTSDISVTITGQRLDAISLKGSGDFTATKVSGDKLTADMAGSGDVVLTGDVGDLTVSLAGSGDLTADHLQSHSADISVAGSGDVQVRASERLHASVFGSGTVTYSGNPPSVSRDVYGAGEVTAK